VAECHQVPPEQERLRRELRELQALRVRRERGDARDRLGRLQRRPAATIGEHDARELIDGGRL